MASDSLSLPELPLTELMQCLRLGIVHVGYLFKKHALRIHSVICGTFFVFFRTTA